MNQNAPFQDIPPVPPQYKDRHTGLVVFGILEIVLGALCLLMVGFMVLGQLMLSRTSGALNSRILLPGILVYVGMAAVFVWLGVGSIQCRRWARALLLILAWGWLCVGVIAVPLMAFLMPRILRASAATGPALPPVALVVIVVVQMVFLTVFMLALPGVLVFFYQSCHVKATCEARDPLRRWTDACPLPVLGVACFLWLGSVSMLLFPLAYGGVLPVFGTIVSRLPGTLLALVLAGLWFWLGLLWYRLKIAGLWALVAVLIVFGLSNVISFLHLDILELYRRMGYPEAQIDLIRRQGWISSKFMLWNSVLWMLPVLGYLFWVKRFFRPVSQVESGQGH
ncbi:MAG TPA: hypothetical protein VG146_22240 [Verrucomicrobiae bacterium]|nr:hypothetical protein [Verrucomicrobiae bacterium]